MKIAFFVNDITTEGHSDTTTRLAKSAAKRDHEVWYVGVGDVDYEPNEKIQALGHRAFHFEGDDLESFLARVGEDENQGTVLLDEFDAIWLRSESLIDLHDRPWAMNMGVVWGQMLADRGLTVVNEPFGLIRAFTKLYLEEFPAEIRPRTIVSRHPDEVKDFIARTGRSVLKPLHGAKGRNVFMVDDVNEPNLNQMLEAVLTDGYITAQEYVDGAEDGDLRLFLVDGEPLQVDGKYAAFKRVPRGAEMRANVSAGGKPEDVEIGETELNIARAMKDKLIADGLFFVGIDIVGDKVVEINADSPGGLESPEYFSQIEFALTICEALENRVKGPPRNLRAV